MNNGIWKERGKDLVREMPRLCSAEEGCKIRASYGFEGGKPERCKKHASPEMVDVVNKTCQHPGCRTQPNYNLPGKSKAAFCREHASPEMVNVVSKSCQHPGCRTQPSYNLPGKSKAAFCHEHASPEMVNVVSKTCQHPGCRTLPSYGFPGQTSTACTSHKQEGMVRRPRVRCKHSKCQQPAYFGLQGQGPKHCEEHAQSNEINLVERKCQQCCLIFVLNADGLCMYCDPAQRTSAVHAKELAVKTMLDAHHYTYESHDRMIEGGVCIRNRPDFVFDAGTHMLVLEVDENQHRGYPCECEQIRMVNIAQAFGMPTTFIRYNPDEYHDGNRRKQNPAESTRHRMLRQWIDFLLRTPPDERLCEVVYLYYDGFHRDKITRDPVVAIDRQSANRDSDDGSESGEDTASTS